MNTTQAPATAATYDGPTDLPCNACGAPVGTPCPDTCTG